MSQLSILLLTIARVLLQPALEMGKMAADALLDIVSGKPVRSSKAIPVEFRTDF